MLIRSERSADREAIHAVHVASFPTPAEARLVDALRASGRLLVSLVAEANKTIVGHVAFSPVETGDGSIGVGLGPLAVWELFRRQGIGAQLVEAGLATSKAAGFGWAVVLGDPNYYQRFGFRASTTFGLSDEYGGGSAFQVVELTGGVLPIGAGLVRYAPEFALFV